MRSPTLSSAIRQGLIGGLVAGALHTGALAWAGTFATEPTAQILASLLRWMGMLGLLGGALTAVVFSILRAVPYVRATPRRERWILGLLPLAVYGLAWAVVLGQGALMTWERGRVGLAARALGFAVMALVLALVAVGILPERAAARSRASGGSRWRSTWVWAVLTTAFLFAPRLLPERHAEVDAEQLAVRRSPKPHAAAQAAFEGGPRNLLLITIDTLRADHLGCYGYARDTSPTIDALAERGVRMERALCPRPTTSPSFATFFTGTYPIRHGIHFTKEVLAPDNLTLAEILRDVGYVTAAVITNGNLFPVFGFDQGFDTYVYGQVRAGEVCDRALDWLNTKMPEDRPWFLWIHSTDPHHPYNPLPPYDTLFSDSTPARWVERQIELYDGEIRYTDDQIARVLDYFTARPALWANTLTVFTSDHGESLGEHDYYFQHGELPYEPSVHIPMVFVAPGVLPEGAVVPSLVTGADLLPTVLEALHVPVPAGVQGGSFLPALLQLEEGPPRDFALIEAGFGEHIRLGRTLSLRRADTKYVHRLTRWARVPRAPADLLWSIDAWLEGGLRSDEVYDLVTDPGETHNLLGQDSHRDARARAWIEAFVRRLAADGQIRSSGAAELDPATLESLKSLGYVH